MTHNAPVKIVLKTLLLSAAVAGLAACASTPPDQGPSKAAATDTQQWVDRIKVTSAPDEIVLAAHASGLSANQGAALEDLFGRWMQIEARELVVTAPNASGAMASQIRDRLILLGAPAARVRVVGFLRYEAQPLKCGQNWENLAATRDNRAYDNFGCALAANLAAQVANPEDLIRPRDMTPADAGRRGVVFGKYRKGEITATPQDTSSGGLISKAIP